MNEAHHQRRQRASLEVRFWAKVLVGDDDSCWDWQAARNAFGYGVIGIGGRQEGMILAHRLSWLIHRGDIPTGYYVLHICDRPQCVNPAHLWLGTYADNNADMSAKRRHVSYGANRDEWLASRRGERHYGAKLTADQVRAIRNSDETTPILSQRYGVAPSTIADIRHGRSWSHL